MQKHNEGIKTQENRHNSSFRKIYLRTFPARLRKKACPNSTSKGNNYFFLVWLLLGWNGDADELSLRGGRGSQSG